MVSINPYDIDKCRAIVEQYLDSIYKKFGTSVYLCYDRSLPRSPPAFTPRAQLTQSTFSCAVFYYLDIVMENNPSVVLDIGCGDNFLKGIVPEIYGIDPISTSADEPGHFNAHYSAKNKGKFESAIAVCSLHFISLTQFRNQVELFAQIIRQGGRGLVTFNSIRMVEKTPDEELMQLFNTTTPTPNQIETYIDQEIGKLTLKLLVAENFITDIHNEFLDGNIRLVFEV